MDDVMNVEVIVAHNERATLAACSQQNSAH